MSIVRLYLRKIAQDSGVTEEYNILTDLTLLEEDAEAGRIAAILSST